MSKYDNVTMKEYMKKKLKMFDDLGRKKGKSNCNGIFCSECLFNEKYTGYNCSSLELLYPEKALEIVMNYEPKVDWSKVPVDTKVLVRDDNCEGWLKRHFTKYENGKIYAYPNGTSSFTYDSRVNNLVSWKYGKLYKEENNEE